MLTTIVYRDRIKKDLTWRKKGRGHHAGDYHGTNKHPKPKQEKPTCKQQRN